MNLAAIFCYFLILGSMFRLYKILDHTPEFNPPEYPHLPWVLIMHNTQTLSIDGNQAAATIAYKLSAGRRDHLPVSAMPKDGTFPTGTACYEKRNLTLQIPIWESDLCTQCGKCVMVCPHSVIHSKIVATDALSAKPANFKHTPLLGKDFPLGLSISYQVAP